MTGWGLSREYRYKTQSAGKGYSTSALVMIIEKSPFVRDFDFLHPPLSMTPEELTQLAASNAKAIEALTRNLLEERQVRITEILDRLASGE